jgi:SAM-dependent methyltransferase
MNNQIPDQREFWNRRHSSELAEDRDINPFAIVAEQSFRPHSTILDLGCGRASDAVYFASKGHSVLATDFSEAVIDYDKKALADSRVDFRVLDLSQPFPVQSEIFDAIYSSLSLHYFDDETTKRIFDEIRRVLKTGATFAFSCKAVNDQHYGEGSEIGKNIFVSSKGHLRHFFTESYVKELLAGGFEIDVLEEVEEEYVGDDSHIIRCIARKI